MKAILAAGLVVALAVGARGVRRDAGRRSAPAEPAPGPSRASMSQRRSYIAAAELGGNIYAVGGMVGETGRFLAVAQRFDPRTNSWTGAPAASGAGAGRRPGPRSTATIYVDRRPGRAATAARSTRSTSPASTLGAARPASRASVQPSPPSCFERQDLRDGRLRAAGRSMQTSSSTTLPRRLEPRAPRSPRPTTPSAPSSSTGRSGRSAAGAASSILTRRLDLQPGTHSAGGAGPEAAEADGARRRGRRRRRDPRHLGEHVPDLRRPHRSVERRPAPPRHAPRPRRPSSSTDPSTRSAAARPTSTTARSSKQRRVVDR